jgi:hypothetical protein
MLYVALIFFCGLAINAKSGVDRAIYGALASAVVSVLVCSRHTGASWGF